MAISFLHPQWGENRPIQGVLFDMDGLVLDSEVLYSRFWREGCKFFGFDMSFQQSLRMRSLGRELGQQVLEAFFGPGIEYNTVRDKRIELMDAYIDAHGVALKPGIRELLAFLKEQGIPAAITSSASVENIRTNLSAHGLDTAFAALCSGRDTPHGKPEPDIYLHGAAVLGVNPKNCLALEDSPAGILSGYRAGCLPVMIPDLDQPDEETRKLLFAQADSLFDIIDLIQRQNAHR